MIRKVFHTFLYSNRTRFSLKFMPSKIGTDENWRLAEVKKLKIHFCAFNHLFPSCKSFDQKSVLVQERFLSQSFVQRRMERI